MNKILIGSLVTITFFIFLIVYLYYYDCGDDKFFSFSKLGCKTCNTCPIDKWYDPQESCTNFSDKICKDYSMPECHAGQRTLDGTETSDRSCELLSECYRECEPGYHNIGLFNCNTDRGLTSRCSRCNECREDEVDIADEECRGRNWQQSNIKNFSSRLVNGIWVPISCEGPYNRMCLKNTYIKYNHSINYNIIFNNRNGQTLNTLSSVSFNINYNTFYYDSPNPPYIISNTINNQYTWNSVSIADIADNNNTTQWQIVSSSRGRNENNDFQNCPIEEDDIIYFCKHFDSTHDLMLVVVRSEYHNEDDKYHIGTIRVPKSHNLGLLSSVANNILKDFKIVNRNGDDHGLLISNSNDFSKYFNLQLMSKDRQLGIFNDTNLYLGYYHNENPDIIFPKIYSSEDNADEMIKINFIRN